MRDVETFPSERFCIFVDRQSGQALHDGVLCFWCWFTEVDENTAVKYGHGVGTTEEENG